MIARGSAFAAVCVVLVAFVGTAPVRAEQKRDDLKTVAAELAAAAKQVAGRADLTTLAVGEFHLNGSTDASSGAAISAALAAALGEFADPRAPLEINGTYRLLEADANGIRAVRIIAQIESKGSGEILKKFLPKEAKTVSEVIEQFPPKGSGVIRHGGTIAQIFNVGGRVPATGSTVERNRAIQQLIGNSENVVAADGSTVLGFPESAYELQILSRPLVGFDPKAKDPFAAAQPCPAKKDAATKDVFVAIPSEHLFVVRVRNRSKAEVAAALTVDGLDVFAFTEERKPDGQPAYSHLIVGGKDEWLVPGWNKTAKKDRDDTFLTFLLTEYGPGAAAKFPNVPKKGAVGAITVSFANSFKKGEARGRGVKDPEVGFGPPVKVDVEVVEREIDVPHEFITVRYKR